MIAYTPFVQPLPIFAYWAWLVLPLCVGVAIVYKSIRCEPMNKVPREAASITFWIMAGLAGAAVVLTVIVKILE
jgi:hypothetical protein